jgi:ribosome-associated toxin RatA of RatAB toxin-antitoxin module
MRATIFRLSILLAAAGITQGANAQASEWELRKSKDGIEVFTRSVEGSKLDEFRGMVTIEAEVDQLVAALKDVAQYGKWIPDCEKSELLKLEGNVQLHYMEMKAPFPVHNRDGYYRYRYIKQGDDMRVEMDAMPTYRPEKKGIVRIPESKGYWLFERLGEGQTRVTYQVHADPGGSIPAWLANSAVVDNPFHTLDKLRDLLQ